MVRKKVKFFPEANIMNTSLLAVTGVSYELLNISIFAVRGDRDANIMFCPCDGCDGYRVLIGGWANQKSFIRDQIP